LGEDACHTVVLFIEVTKALARAWLLKLFPGEILCAGGQFESHVPPPADAGEAAAPETAVAASPATPAWTGRRTGRSLKVPQSLQVYTDRLALTSASPARGLQRWFRVWGEMLHILRPVVYTMLARRMRESWAPWLCSLFVDLLALRCTSLADKAVSGWGEAWSLLLSEPLSAPAYKHDAAEFGRRKLLLLFYLLRSPLYEAGVGRLTALLVDSSKGVRGVEWVMSAVADQVAYYHNTHFYSSAS
jgi:peroxin-16